MKLPKVKPLYKMIFIIFVSVFIYYAGIKGNIDWAKIIGYTFIFWMWFITVLIASGFELFKEN
jgi:hypothetical protein